MTRSDGFFDEPSKNSTTNAQDWTATLLKQPFGTAWWLLLPWWYLALLATFTIRPTLQFSITTLAH